MKTVRYLMLLTLLTTQVRGKSTAEFNILSQACEDKIYQLLEGAVKTVTKAVAAPQKFVDEKGLYIALGVTGALVSYIPMCAWTGRYFPSVNKRSPFMSTISFVSLIGACGLGSCALFADCNPFADCGPWGYYAPAAVGILGLVTACEGCKQIAASDAYKQMCVRVSNRFGWNKQES